MLKLNVEKLSLSGGCLSSGGKVIAEFKDMDDADRVYNLLVKFYLDSKKQGVYKALKIGGASLFALGFVLEGINYIRELKH